MKWAPPGPVMNRAFTGSCFPTGMCTVSYWADEAFTAGYARALSRAFAAFARHVNAQQWDQPVFQFYLNNKISYREHGSFWEK